MSVRITGLRLVLLFSALVLTGYISTYSPQYSFAQATASAAPAGADTSAIQSQIDAHNQHIKDLQDEISKYQSQLNTLGSQHQTLQTAIKTIDVSRSQTQSQIKVTQNKIDASNLMLQELSGQISEKQYQISLDKKSVAQSMRELAASEDNTIIERVFAAGNLAEAWSAADSVLQVNDALRTHAQDLSGVTAQLNGKKDDVSTTKTQLTSLDKNLSAQQQSLDANKAAKAQLLTQTKNQESSYQSLIAQKKAQQKSFESELTSLQSQLKSVSKASIPVIQTGVLAWPYSTDFAAHCQGISSALGNIHCVTQYFGNTAFAASGAYSGAGHNGIDIGMPVGTPIAAALAGTILGTGNTDLSHDAAGNQCYSFGKWVMIKHANGLDTLYGHLSQISVSTGQSVGTGDVIGYSGMTGYATGPHLHFGVYASAGVQILTLNQFRGATTPCGNASMPVAPLNAYLNPINYL